MTPADAVPDPPASARSDAGLKLALLLVFVLAALRVAWLCDDAFISFRTVDNFVHGYGLTWNTDERVQAYTHPLWLFLVAAAYALTHEIFLTAIFLSIAVSAAAVAIVVYRLTIELPRALLFVSLMVVSQALLDFSSSGLENPLSCLLVALFVMVWQQPADAPRRLFNLFLIGGLTALNRQDLVLLLAPALAVALRESWGWKALRTAAMALLPLLGWELFSLIYYGFPFPNTYYAKLSTGIPAVSYVAQGFIYLEDALTQDPATALILVLAIALGLSPKSRLRQAPLAAGMLLYLAYVVSVGGDFMQGRFLSVPAFLGAILLGRHPRTLSVSTIRLPAGALLVLAAALANHLFVNPRYDEGLSPEALKFRGNGIANERQFYAVFGQTLGRLNRSLKLPDDHPWARDTAAWRAAPAPRVVPVQVAGVVGYMAGPTVHLVDRYALSEPLLARLPISGAWRIGHFERNLPPGLLESLRTGQNQLADPGLARLFDQLQRVTRGPIWSLARFKAILFLNSGEWRTLLDGYTGPVQVTPEQLATAKPDHYSWNGPGSIVLTRSGLVLHLGAEHHESRFTASLDNNDDYRFRFYRGEALTGELTLTHGYFPGAGLRVWNADVPATAVEQGYDRIEVVPSGGDGWYAIGHLLLTPP